jgi:hypothetical protein
MKKNTPTDVASRAERLHQKFKTMLSRRLFIRLHMTFMLSLVILSGMLGSRLLRAAGMKNMMWRLPLMTIIAYLVFFLLVRLWIRYIAAVSDQSRNSGSSLPDAPDGGLDLGNSSGSIFRSYGFQGGGGRFGGGGASGSFGGSSSPAESAMAGSPGRSFSGGGSSFSLDLDDDGLVLLVVFALLALAILGAGFFVVYQAPTILSDAAFQACLGSGLLRTVKRTHDPSWSRSILKATAIPFVIVLALSAAAGYEAHKLSPESSSIREVWNECIMK